MVQEGLVHTFFYTVLIGAGFGLWAVIWWAIYYNDSLAPVIRHTAISGPSLTWFQPCFQSSLASTGQFANYIQLVFFLSFFLFSFLFSQHFPPEFNAGEVCGGKKWPCVTLFKQVSIFITRLGRTYPTSLPWGEPAAPSAAEPQCSVPSFGCSCRPPTPLTWVIGRRLQLREHTCRQHVRIWSCCKQEMPVQSVFVPQ